ncbi:MAG: aldose 1-epimerase family protein [Clostridia bacterium]|jgi:galactose mutarotase-like enzyme|nr:aldose 1-epimerase family protein [Clostridia bacterium]
MVTLRNKEMTVTINPVGAEMYSITAANGTEYLWEGDPKFWDQHAPVMFPICSGLKNDEFRYNGKTYRLDKHGYGKFETFEVESQSETEAVFLLRSNAKSLAVFPFEYELRIRYALRGKSIDVVYDVTNPAKEPLYMSIGSHEAYACPEGIQDYEIVFPQPETLVSTPDPMGSYDTELIMENQSVLPMDYKYFQIDALIFKKCVKSTSVQLRHKKTGRGVQVDFEGFPYLLFWTKVDAPYLCIEPWCGITDTPDTDGDITKKEGINRVESGETFHRVHTITLL